MPFEIKIENINEIREVFRMYPVIANREIQNGLLEAGKTISGQEKREAPVGVTAHLKQSIGIRLKSGSVIIVPKKNMQWLFIKGLDRIMYQLKIKGRHFIFGQLRKV